MVRFLLQGALALLLAAALPSTPVEAYRPGDQVCSYKSSPTKCGLSSITPSKTDKSVLIYPGGKTRCAFDDYTDPTTGFSTNATYFFQVFPKPQKKKLLLMLQGGGACIDDATCSFALQCSLPSALVRTTATASAFGYTNVSDPKNSFKDWNVVYMPYCTGDLHMGSRVLNAFESGIERNFGRPQCLGQNKTMHLNGFENVKAALQWAKTNYPSVQQLVIGGTSAGSLGAQLLTPYVADLWAVKKTGISFGVLADSYVGVLPANRPSGKVLSYYGSCDVDLKWSAASVAACKNQTLASSELGVATLKSLPKSKWLFINSMGDATQRQFYQLAKDGILGYPFANMIAAADYFVEFNKIIDAYKAVSTKVSTFIVSGEQHVFLASTNFYETVSSSGEVLGAYLTNWLAKF